MIEKKKFTESETRMAQIAKALSHPARIAILNVLISKNTCICGEIVNELPLSQSTVSQHLKELKKVGIIKGEIEGVKVCYCIDEIVWQEISTIFVEFLKTNENQCC